MSVETSTEIVDTRLQLIEEAHQARAHLLTVGTFLVSEAIGEGDPARDITGHPDYIEAQERLCNAVSALGELASASKVDY
jgi:hypothetical protein